MSSEVTVGNAGGCTTGIVLGLSKQIAEEVDCTSAPNTLIGFHQTPTIRFASGAVLPYLSTSAKTDLAAASSHGRLIVASGYRTVAQQFLLYRWYRHHECSIPKAASPGTSNHESARAVDLDNYATRRSEMAAHHWSEDVVGDPAHFEHLSSPDIRGRDVAAFQRLWNRNHPNDQIGVDGVYGPTTANRLSRSPASGFAKGAKCASHRGLEVVSIDGPDRVAPGAQAHYAFTVVNADAVDWPADTRLAVTDGGPSELYDAASWQSPTEVMSIGAIAAGAQAVIDLDVVAPSVTEDTPVTTTFSLTSGSQELGTFELAFTVTPNGDTGASGDPGDADAPDDDDSASSDPGGGCSAGGGAGGCVTGVLALALVVRRRRRL